MNYTMQIKTSSQAADLLRSLLGDLDHEELWGLFLNRQGTLITGQMLTKGTLSTTLIDARCILKRALLLDATSVIIGHNHPSGSPSPSLNDIAQTDRIRKACNLMDVALVDHIIIGEDEYFSFSDERATNYKPSKR